MKQLKARDNEGFYSYCSITEDGNVINWEEHGILSIKSMSGNNRERLEDVK